MSNLTITKRQLDDVVVVDLDGPIALGESNRQLHEAIRSLVQDEKKHVVLNLAKVSRIDSSGLGELIAGYATLEKSGGTLRLANMSDRVIELMTMTKLLTVFDIFDNEADAVESFNKTDRTTQPLDASAPASASAGKVL